MESVSSQLRVVGQPELGPDNQDRRDRGDQEPFKLGDEVISPDRIVDQAADGFSIPRVTTRLFRRPRPVPSLSGTRQKIIPRLSVPETTICWS